MNNRIIRKAIFILLPVTVWICFYCIFHDELSADVTPVFTLLISFASVLSIAGLFYLLYSITNDTLKDARQEAELLALNQQQKLKEQQNQTLASRRQQTLSLQENVQRDLHTYETLMDNGQYEEAAHYLERLTFTFQKERFHPICGDNLINAILDSKRQTASQHNIRTSFQLLLPEKMKIETSDLSSIFFNLMDNGQYEEAAHYLERLTFTFQKERFHPICGDNLINAILDSKRQTASQHNIRTSFQLLLPEKMKIETSDLSSIFFNLMDNGIESCQNSHSSDPFIQITASQNANFLTIHMTNSKDPSYKFNHKTNKTDSWAHGFGLAIIEEIASKYDGSCQWIDGGDVFESVVMVEVG